MRTALDARGHLLTLLGPPGVGKTRLAMRYAAEHARAGGAVWFCDLSSARDEAEIIAAIAQSVDVELGGERAAAERALALRLVELGTALFVLDNVEQVVGPAAGLLERWLDVLPELTWLVTSRQRLDVGGEEVLDIEPLPIADAAQLFSERASAIAKGRPIGSEDETVTALVARLDGIPLAVELAAARVRVLSPASLLERLGERLDAARPTVRGGATFLRTLENAIGWSWSMLPDEERAALARVSVFAGGFDLDAAFAVLGDDALELLAALVDKSLISVEPQGTGVRYRLYESIRAFAAQRLDELGEREVIEDQHAAVYLREDRVPPGETAGDGLRTWQHAERDNVLAIHRRGVARARPDLVVGAADKLCGFYLLHGPLASHEAVVERAMTAAEASGDEGLLARARILRGQLSKTTGQHESALRDLEDARAVLADGDDRLEARALQLLAQLAAQAGRFEDARHAATRAHRLHKKSGRAGLAARVQLDLGGFCGLSGRSEEARRLARGALLVAEDTGDRSLQAASLAQLATLALRDGDRLAARGWYERARDLWRELGTQARVASVNIKLGRLAYEESRAEDARVQLEEGIATLRRIAGAGGIVAEATSLLGALALERGDLDDALEHTAAGVAQLAGAGDPLDAFVLALRGATLCAADDVDAAEQAFDEVDAALARGARASVERAAFALRAPLLAISGDTAAAKAALAATDDVRLGSRVRAARRFAAQVLALRTSSEQTATVRVADDGTWLHVPAAARVDLSRRRVLRRLLLALAQRRVAEPGALLASVDLVAAGWPGERMLEKSAQDRLWVAIRSLRRLGLDGILITGREGYLLDADLPLELVSAP